MRKEVEEITGTRINKKGAISEYRVRSTKGDRWLLKDVAIALAEKGRLHAIVVHAKKGAYLRPEYHSRSFRDMIC